MYPSAQLGELTQRKRVLRQRIAATRSECIMLAAEAARPLAFIDRVREQWRKVSPVVKWAAIPLALLFGRRSSRRRGSPGLLHRLSRWVPIVLSATRLLRGLRPPAETGPAAGIQVFRRRSGAVDSICPRVTPS